MCEMKRVGDRPGCVYHQDQTALPFDHSVGIVGVFGAKKGEAYHDRS